MFGAHPPRTLPHLVDEKRDGDPVQAVRQKVLEEPAREGHQVVVGDRARDDDVAAAASRKVASEKRGEPRPQRRRESRPLESGPRSAAPRGNRTSVRRPRAATASSRARLRPLRVRFQHGKDRSRPRRPRSPTSSSRSRSPSPSSRIAELGLARELRLGQVRHPDHARAPGAVKLRLGARRELRAPPCRRRSRPR